MSGFKKSFYIQPHTGLEICAFYDFEQPFPPHFHEYYLLGCLLRGKRYFHIGNSKQLIGKFDLVFLKPGAPHFCEQAGAEKAVWLCLNIPASAMDRIMPADSALKNYIFKNKYPGQEFIHIHSNLQKHPRMGLAPLSRLISKLFIDLSDSCLHVEESPTPMVEIAAYLAKNVDKNFSLKEMCLYANMSKYHFIRSFFSSNSMTPHSYLRILRLNYAQNLLKKGQAISLAAQCAGFYDQSHFSKCLLASTGFTPGFYRTAYMEAKR